MKELNHRLGLLADEATPAPVDVYDVIAKAKTRTRNRRTTAATVLATATVAGAMVATIGLTGSSGSGVSVGSSPTSTTSQPSSSPTIPPVLDDRATRFTEALAEAWPTIAPGVAAETSEEYERIYGQQLAALEFVGSQIEGDWYMYHAYATLADAEGTTQLEITVQPTSAMAIGSGACDLAQGCILHQLPDGSTARHIDYRHTSESDARMHDLAVDLANGTTVIVKELNEPYGQMAVSRPSHFLSVEALGAIAVLFDY